MYALVDMTVADLDTAMSCLRSVSGGMKGFESCGKMGKLFTAYYVYEHLYKISDYNSDLERVLFSQ